MPREFDYLKETFERLNAMAAAQGRRLHPTSFVEIQNYLLHRKVRRLSEAQKSLVALKIGEALIAKESQPSEKAIGAERVRNVILSLCPDAFKTCDHVALRILRAQDPSGDLSVLSDDEGVI